MAIQTQTFKKTVEISNNEQAAKPENVVQPPIKPKDLAIIGAIVVIWGLAFVGMKEAALDASPFKAAGLRFFIGSLPLMVVALRPSRLRKLRRIDFVKFGILGFFQTTLLFGINFTAIPHVPVGVMSIILNTNPFFVAIFAHFLIKGDRLNKQKVGGLLIGFGGVLVLVLGGGSGLGDVAFYWPLILLLASMMWATSSILVKLFRFEDMLVATAWQSLIGSIPLLLIGFTTETKPIDWSWSFVLWLLYIAIPASSFGWWAWNGILQRYSASRVSVFLFLIPVCGVLSGVLLLGESLSFNLLVGGILVAAGIILVNIRLKSTARLATSQPTVASRTIGEEVL